MAARRCSKCGIAWPNNWRYEKCPQCREQTSYFADEDSIPEDEADRLARRAEFERYYEKRGPRDVELPKHVERSIAEIQALESIPVLEEAPHGLE